MSFSKSSNESHSNPYSMVQQDLTGGRSQLGGIFQNALRQNGMSLAWNPQGNVGSIYNALYSKDPSQDYLGAKQRLGSIISGSANGDNYAQALKFMTPQMERNLQLMGTQLTNQSGGQGLRFSSDLMNQQRAGALDLMLGTQGQAWQQANQMTGQQLGAAQGLYNQIGQLGQADLERLMPLIVKYMTTFAPVGNASEGSGNGFGAGIGMSSASSK